MSVLVDTQVWSLAFGRNLRKKEDDQNLLREELSRLVDEQKACITGSIRQEVLSGISEFERFNALKNSLAEAVEDIPLITADYERAAEMYNLCRSKGIQGSQVDFLTCAVAERRHLCIFTYDNDFCHFQRCLNVLLYRVNLKATAL